MITMKELGFEEVTEHSFTLRATLYLLRNDVLVIISGIEDHLGSLSLAQPYQAPLNPHIKPANEDHSSHERISSSVSTLTQYHHRDDQLLSEFSRSLSQKLNRVVAVVGGIHVPNISKKDIELLSKMMKELEDKILLKIKKD